MTDMEKVIDGLNEVLNDLYMSVQPKHVTAITDALTLLKEQEPVKPIKTPEVLRDEYTCGNCQEEVGIWLYQARVWYFKAKYCPECGRKVKWDEA